jgi:predicted enzyme related to lactoylglutathione lyase
MVVATLLSVVSAIIETMTNELDEKTAGGTSTSSPTGPPPGREPGQGQPRHAEPAGGRPRIELGLVVLDTDDPRGLSQFYCELLGWEVDDADDDWVTIRGKSGAAMAFQLSINHIPPTWPDGSIPQQFHLDLYVSDLRAAASYAQSVGAKRVRNAGKERSFIVFTDPSGHPFCLCASERLANQTKADPP